MTFVVIWCARRWWWAAVPAALAVIAAVGLFESPPAALVRADAAAMEPVCTDDGGPAVCVTRAHAFVLDDLVPHVREEVARWDGVDGGLTGIVGMNVASVPETVDGTYASIHTRGFISRTGGWAAPPERNALSAQILNHLSREIRTCGFAYQNGGTIGMMHGWLMETPDSVLLQLPGQERTRWLSDFMTALADCDASALERLSEEV